MISKEDVKHIAGLARLELTEQEIEKMQKDLSSVLDYFKLLEKAPKPYFAVISAELNKNSLRKDEVVEKPASLANNLIAVAPNKQDEYIKVKAIL